MTDQRHPVGNGIDVIVVGRANVDLNLHVPQCSGTGAPTVFATAMTTGPGGKSLNQAVAVNRLGGRSALVANIGDDPWAEPIRRCLEYAGVEATHTRTVAGATTSAAVVQVTPDGENAIVLAVSADTELSEDDVTAALAGQDASVIVTQLDLPPEAAAAAICAPRSGLLIANLIPHLGLDRGLLAAVDVFVVNEHEAAAVLGRHQPDPLTAARQLHELGPATAVVTAGAAGAAYHSNTQHGHVPAPTITAVDTTGAGDAFLAALALALARDTPLPDAVTRAVQVGAYAVQQNGALLPRQLEGLLSW